MSWTVAAWHVGSAGTVLRVGVSAVSSGASRRAAVNAWQPYSSSLSSAAPEMVMVCSCMSLWIESSSVLTVLSGDIASCKMPTLLGQFGTL